MVTPRRFLGLALVALALLAPACQHVAPYEREYLSRPSMDPETERAEQRFDAHLRDAREASLGGADSTGGGCGCN